MAPLAGVSGKNTSLRLFNESAPGSATATASHLLVALL
jgi:hypothetical protein